MNTVKKWLSENPNPISQTELGQNLKNFQSDMVSVLKNFKDSKDNKMVDFY